MGGEEALKALDKKIHGNVKFYDSPVWETFIAWMLGKDDEMTEEKLLELSMDDMKKYAREFMKEVDAHPIQQPYIDGLDAGKINENAAWYGTFFGRALSKISYKGYPEKESVNTLCFHLYWKGSKKTWGYQGLS